MKKIHLFKYSYVFFSILYCLVFQVWISTDGTSFMFSWYIIISNTCVNTSFLTYYYEF